MNKPGRVIVLRVPDAVRSPRGTEYLLTLLRLALRDKGEWEPPANAPIVTAMGDSARVVDLWDMVRAAEERCAFDQERAASYVAALTEVWGDE
jgi:hypothetical protein